MLQSIQKARADVEELGEQITQLEAENASLQLKCKETSESTNKLHCKITELEGVVEQSAIDIAALQECVRKLHGKITTLQEDKAFFQDKWKESCRLIEKLNGERATITQQLQALELMAAEASENLFTMSFKDMSECFKNIRQLVATLRSLPQPEEGTEEQQLSTATPKKTPARVKTARKDRRTNVPTVVPTETGPPKTMTQRNKPTSMPKKK